MIKTLKGKKILVTAGPVWEPIDRVRVITNIFGGALGVKIASWAQREGAEVTLVFGPGRAELPSLVLEKSKVIRFHYFDELFKIMKEEISSGKYDIVIHSAAVSDYRPTEVGQGKIASGQKELVIHFVPTVKIVDFIKRWDPSVFLVKFKLEVGLTKEQLIKKASRSMLQSNADLMVANDFNDVVGKQHKAFIIQKNADVIECQGKDEIAKKIILIVGKKFNA